jgi:cytochrome c2
MRGLLRSAARPMGGSRVPGAADSRMSRLLPVLVHLAAAAVVFLAPLLLASSAGGNSRRSAALFCALAASAYLAAALPGLLRHAAEPGFVRIAGRALAAFGAAFIFHAAAQWKFPEIAGTTMPFSVAFAALALGLILLLALTPARAAPAWKLLVLAPLVLATAWGHARHRPRPAKPPLVETTYVDSSLYVLKMTSYRKRVADGNTRGGAVAPLAGGYLLAAGDGWLYSVSQDPASGTLSVEKLRHRVPYNPDEFSAGGRKIFGDAWRDNSMDKLRIADLLVRQGPGDALRVFVSHHYWKADLQCTVVRVSVLEGTTGELLGPAGNPGWKTLYETTPCLALNQEGRRGLRFGGLQVGGALGLLSDDELLLTVGDHEFDGFKRSEALPQDPSNSYGKVIRIRLASGEAETYTLGHRNPQGLYVMPDRSVWVLEHGPRGGDELNLLHPGANYGWPAVTYGTDYRMHEWPLSSTPGRHEGFEKPAYAFVPSIAVSQLAGVQGALFDRWRGDLLAGSFFGGLNRIRIEDNRVVFAEPIRISGRIRDVTEGVDGRILVWTDENDLVFIEPAASDAAENLLTQCIVCHTLSERETVSVAPGLRGIVGRPVASADNFAYSEAMAAFGGRWTEDRLDRFLENPAAAVPGTTMAFEGIDDAGERRQIIELLKLQVEEQQRGR